MLMILPLFRAKKMKLVEIKATISYLVRGFLGNSDNERGNYSGEQRMEGETSYCARDQPRDSESMRKTDSDHPLETKIQKLELKMEGITNEFKANKLFFERAIAQLSGKCESTQARSQILFDSNSVRFKFCSIQILFESNSSLICKIK